MKVRQVAEELGVRYVLEGSVRRVGNQVRINAQLIDATTGGHIWADRYDGTLEDVFALQDEVSRKIVSALAVTLTPDEQQRLSQAAKASPEAYDLLLRGLERYRRFTRETNVEAREFFERAVAIDPDFARAHADIALTHAEDIFHSWTESPERSSQLALDIAQYALTLDDDSRVGRFALAYTYLNMKRYDEALAENQRVLDLDPNHAEGHAQRGMILNYVGRPAEGLDAIWTAMRLDPRHPFFYVWILGQAHFLLRQTEEAIAQFEKSIESNPDFVIAHIMLASAYAHAGRIEDAEWEAEEILVLLPDFTLAAEREKAAYKNPAHLEYYLDGLRKAGIPENPPLKLPDKPSIAVLPFTNMSGDPEQEYFADGMTEDLITDLAKISGLLVIARNSSFAYKGQSFDVREVAKQLGVRYVVEGSVRKAGGRIRINAQLIDAETGTHLWAERYDRDATDVFDLQDEVRARIVTALRVKLTPVEVTRLARQMTDNAEAYDYYIRGLRQESFFTKEGNLESLRLFEKALELDPTFAAAMGRLATAHTLAAENGWSPAPEESMETARLLAEKAVALDDDLPQAHWAVARVYSRKASFDGDRAIASLRKAIALDPNYADGHALLATVLFFVGRAEESLGHIETAMRLNPHFPFWYYYALGASQFMLTRYDAAIESLEKAIERNTAWQVTHRILVAAYGHLGMIDEAEWEMEELRMLGFEPTLANWRSRVQIQDPAYLARYFDGLRKAGVPE